MYRVCLFLSIRDGSFDVDASRVCAGVSALNCGNSKEQETSLGMVSTARYPNNPLERNKK